MNAGQRAPARRACSWCAIRCAACTSSPDKAHHASAAASATAYFCSEKCRQASGWQAVSASEAQLRADIVEVGRRLYARGYTASNDGNISVRLDARPAADDADQRLQGLHDARDDVHHGSRRAEARRRARPVVRDADAPRGLPAAPGRAGGRARASADRNRVRRRRDSARPAPCSPRSSRRWGACRLRSTRRRRRRSCPRPSASTSRRTTACCWPTTAR